jgi:hypothetical protein
LILFLASLIVLVVLALASALALIAVLATLLAALLAALSTLILITHVRYLRWPIAADTFVASAIPSIFNSSGSCVS